jgi:YVTN family beta-propeller protein
MRMKLRFLAGALVLLALGILAGCTTASNNNGSSQPGFLYVTAAGNASISSFSIDLGTGDLTLTGSSAATGASPTALALTPAFDAIFVANGQGSGQPGTISSYSTGSSGGSPKATGNSVNAGINPTHLAIDAAGKFLFVANEGIFSDPTSGTISVFAISGTSLSEVTGSPFQVAPLNSTTTGVGPGWLAVTPDGKYLYVANRFANTVSAFSISSSGVLTEVGGSPYTVGTAPAGLAITPDGGFLYVANSSSNNLSAFAICNQVVLNCPNPSLGPDGTLTAISGSPIAVTVEPVAIAVTPDDKYLYVVNHTSSQISEFSISSGSGGLTALSSAAISTGTNPVSIALRAGTTVTSTSTSINYVYIANETGGTISVFSYDTANGVLGVAEQPVPAPSGQPTAVAAQ